MYQLVHPMYRTFYTLVSTRAHYSQVCSSYDQSKFYKSFSFAVHELICTNLVNAQPGQNSRIICRLYRSFLALTGWLYIYRRWNTEPDGWHEQEPRNLKRPESEVVLFPSLTFELNCVHNSTVMKVKGWPNPVLWHFSTSVYECKLNRRSG